MKYVLQIISPYIAPENIDFDTQIEAIRYSEETSSYPCVIWELSENSAKITYINFRGEAFDVS